MGWDNLEFIMSDTSLKIVRKETMADLYPDTTKITLSKSEIVEMLITIGIDEPCIRSIFK